ncbi:MAG: solute:sodium symporter family transporter [Candidatus Neomarinimicrobiota bacterium]|nr:solute:sodium symporter family transporter [Candidatus Neomarinimicrobiota bacterium]
MKLTLADGLAFVAFLGIVVGVSLYASRREKDTKDYFLAGRHLTWWLIGFSLIASNISTEHFVGMAGAGFGEAGLAIASYEWIAAVTLVVMGLWLLPLFLRLGIYTMPEFLEHRYGRPARTLMAVYMMIAYIGVAIAAVLYSGALGLRTIFGLDLTTGIWLIGLLAGAYTIYGGLKAVVWSDLIQGSALLLGGLFVTILGLNAVGGLDSFLTHNADKLHTILPADHPDIPWTAMLFGIWIPNFFYWGFNQFITQRTLGSKSLAHGQDGIMFAAFIKLIIPFIIVFPGIIAFQLYGDQITNGDQAYAVLIQNLLPAGLRGIMFAALFGAVMSSLDSMLNSAATIFTMDIYAQHFVKTSSPEKRLRIGRIATGVFVVLGCLIAPLPGKFEGVFRYIQMVWGFISPGIVAVFFFGIINRRAPLSAALWGMALSVPLYGALNWAFPNIAFLNHMAISFTVIVAVMAIITRVNPLPEPVMFVESGEVDLTPSPRARKLAAVIVVLTIFLYIIFW